MAGKEEAQNTMRWIADEQTIHETAPYGDNLKTVDEALSAQTHRVKLVNNYGEEIQKLSDDPKGKELNVSEAYDALKEVASKRLHCLEDIQQIAGLESLFGTLTSEFAQKATKLVETEVERAAAQAGQQDTSEGVAKAAQNCILAVRANWCWISKLVKCADTHLNHVSDYHQFFHTAAEYDEWMPADLRKATQKVSAKEDMPADKEEANRLLLDLKEVLTIFLHWHGKIDTLFDQSRKVIPVHLRTKKLDYFRPVSALCDYKTKEMVVREGEELTLTDNADSQSWQVKNMHNKESNVPSVILVIPGPDPAAIDSAFKLRMQLLALWTQNVKRIGKSLIWFMILCLKDWTDDEINKLKAIPAEQKNDIRRCLTYIEECLLPYWADYKGFQELQTRITTLRSILDQEGNPKDYDADFTNDLVAKFGTIEELLKRYKDFWTFWDTFRIMCEACRSPEFLLIVERWQQLKYLDMDELRRRWHTGFGFDNEDQDEFLAWLERWMVTHRTTTVEEVVRTSEVPARGITEITKAESVTLEQGPGGTLPGSTVTGSERVVEEQTRVIRSGHPGATVEERSQVQEMTTGGSGYTKTQTVTTVTKTQTIEGDTFEVSGGGSREAVSTATTTVERSGPQGQVISEVMPGEAQTVSKTTVTTLSAAPGSDFAVATEMGTELSSSKCMQGETVTRSLTETETSSSSTGALGGDATRGEAGEGSFGYGMSSSSMTTTTGKTPESISADFGSSGSNSYFEQTTTKTVSGGDMGSFGSGFSQSTTTVTEGDMGSFGSGFSGSTTTVTEGDMGSFGSGFSESIRTVTEGDMGSFGSGFSESTTTTKTTGTRSLVSGSSEAQRSSATSEVTQSMDEGSFGSGYSESRVQEVIQSTESMSLGASRDEVEGMTDLAARTETATSEQVSTSQQEERKTFVITEECSPTESVMVEEKEESQTFIIKGVIDPSTQEEITMQDAVLKGIINSTTGCYVNTVTGEQWPIPVAMNAGFIKVEFTTTKKTAEKRRDVGLITIRTQRESRPYTVKAVVDAKTERRLTVDEAIAAGILDQTNGTYLNTMDNETMSLADAIDSNLLLVEYDKDAEVGEPEVVSKTYAIHSVVDQKAKKTVSFSQAIRKGLLDKETGAYYHNITGEYTYVGDAIKRGFVKATVVKDPNSLDIDPENKLVVEQLQNIRKKLLNPMKALATLRKAAAAEAGK